MNKYWFRKRRGLLTKDLGWGWIPISWEGWVTIASALALIVASGFAIGVFSDEATLQQGFLFIAAILAVIGLGALVSHATTKP